MYQAKRVDSPNNGAFCMRGFIRLRQVHGHVVDAGGGGSARAQAVADGAQHHAQQAGHGAGRQASCCRGRCSKFLYAIMRVTKLVLVLRAKNDLLTQECARELLAPHALLRVGMHTGLLLSDNNPGPPRWATFPPGQDPCQDRETAHAHAPSPTFHRQRISHLLDQARANRRAIRLCGVWCGVSCTFSHC